MKKAKLAVAASVAEVMLAVASLVPMEFEPPQATPAAKVFAEAKHAELVPAKALTKTSSAKVLVAANPVVVEPAICGAYGCRTCGGEAGGEGDGRCEA